MANKWPRLMVALHRFGRRGAVLTLLGSMWIFIGVGMVIDPIRRFSRLDNGDNSALDFMDRPGWAMLWVVCGTFAAVAGFLRMRVRVMDELGFNSLLVPSLTWTATYAWSALTWLATQGGFGRERAWAGALLYGVIVVVLLVVAGWPDPIDETTEEERNVR